MGDSTDEEVDASVISVVDIIGLGLGKNEEVRLSPFLSLPFFSQARSSSQAHRTDVDLDSRVRLPSPHEHPPR